MSLVQKLGPHLPYLRRYARALTGSQAHGDAFVRATLEAIAFEVQDVVDLMVREAGISIPELAVDGGASANDLLCQLQADALQVPVARAAQLETTTLGAAFLAGIGTGVWSSTDELAAVVHRDARFDPGQADERAHQRWRVAVERSKSWATL